jgi:epoxyqueuosine reductase
MMADLKQRLIARLAQVGAYAVGVADPQVGYEHALPNRHPLDVWPDCRSVIVYAVATSPQSNNTYIGPLSPCTGDRALGPVPSDMASPDHAADRLCRLFLNAIGYWGADVLLEAGARISLRKPQLKLSAYEAGVGVYGKSGLILHPVLGSRIRLGCLLTDALLEPEGRLTGFDPCADCDRCQRACPAKAFDPSKPYPASWNRAACEAKRAEIAARGLYCHNCYAVCPAGQVTDQDLLWMRESISLYRPLSQQT